MNLVTKTRIGHYGMSIIFFLFGLVYALAGALYLYLAVEDK